jgi:hypothetical protein
MHLVHGVEGGFVPRIERELSDRFSKHGRGAHAVRAAALAAAAAAPARHPPHRAGRAWAEKKKQ